MVTSPRNPGASSPLRIISLVSAATEWLTAFGAGQDIVGRSHACTFTGEGLAAPVVTAPAHPLGDSSFAIDQSVRRLIATGAPLYSIDAGLLQRLAAEVVVTPDLCEVCASPAAQLRAALQSLDPPPRLVSFAPSTFKEILDAALRLGHAVGRGGEAMQFIGSAEASLQALRVGLGLHRRMDEASLPTVVCLEWLDPLMTASHWVPDLVQLAGGRPLLSRKGARSEAVSWDSILEADPDVLVAAPCGFSIADTLQEIASLTSRPGWQGLRAVRTGRVFLLDGNACLSRPGPRLYRAVELLASALYPERARGAVPAVESRELHPLGVHPAAGL